MFLPIIIAAVLAGAPREQVLDAFDLAAPFATQPNLRRVYIDRTVSLDLTEVNQFDLDISADPPACVGEVSLYFKSGDGWYSAGSGLKADGWHTLSFIRTLFRTEDRPAGWNKIDGIRIAVWRGAAHDGRIRVGRLATVRWQLDRVAPKPNEARAFWNHSGTGAYPGDWERTARELAAAGFTMVFPNMLWAGRAHYPSDLLPPSDTLRQHGDQVAACVTAAHRHGLQVHVWKVNHYLLGAPAEFIEKLRREGRTQVSAAGKPMDWLCPSHPLNFQLERDSMLEVARKYNVDGLQFDYIRYPNGDCCYCPGCRERFEAADGRPVDAWPKDCYTGPRRDEYRRWRCEQITRLVEAVHREAKKIRPGIKISAAVFGAYPDCRQSVGQDWVAWTQAGCVDFVCPMDYTESDGQFASLVVNQAKLIGGRVPFYPGIGATASHSALSPQRVLDQIRLARGLGADGFTIFNLDRATIQSLAPALGLRVK